MVEDSLRTLVVEDDNFQRFALIDILELQEYLTDDAENGRIAWEKLNDPENHYDLVLLDLLMPEMDGLELLTLMKSNEHTKDIPVIVMTSNQDNGQVGDFLSQGACDFIIKPVRG